MNKYFPFLFSLLLFSSCQSGQEKALREVLQQPMRHLTSYRFDVSAPVISRVRPVEPFLLQYLKDMDQDTNYKNYNPTESERKIISDALDKLPPLNKKILKERLVGLYFVTGLYGSGLTDWLIDNRGEIYCVMFINPAILKMNLSEWLTWKENTAFRPDNPSNRIVINCGAGISGFSGILTHESTHAVDYVMNITPYVEPMTLSYDRFRKKKIPGITGFVKGIWNDYGQPAGKNDFHFRKQVHFYSNDPSKKIPIASGNDCYRELVNSPFVSLYGSKIWAEDLAELVLFFHITRVLWQPYEITVDSAGNKPVVYRPLENPKVLERFKNIRMFYEE